MTDNGITNKKWSAFWILVSCFLEVRNKKIKLMTNKKSSKKWQEKDSAITRFIGNLIENKIEKSMTRSWRLISSRFPKKRIILESHACSLLIVFYFYIISFHIYNLHLYSHNLAWVSYDLLFSNARLVWRIWKLFCCYLSRVSRSGIS